jgi:hypothetical protein
MVEKIDINFKVTPSQKETIGLRAEENGFDDIAAYLKVVSLKAQPFNISSAGLSEGEGQIELGFQVTESQKASLEEKIQESGAKDLDSFLTYVALHGVVTSVIEIRSTGNLNSMLERIAASKRR